MPPTPPSDSDGPAVGFPVVRLEPMTWPEFDVWAERSWRGFAAQQVAAGLQPRPEAERDAREQLARTLSDGLATPMHRLWTVLELAGAGAADAGGVDARAETPVGALWLQVQPGPADVEVFVFDVEITGSARGRGLGRATMQAAEQAARACDATVMRLNVFGHNTRARRLYDDLGYAVTSTTMTRSLGQPVDPQLGRSLGPSLGSPVDRAPAPASPGPPAHAAVGAVPALREVTEAEYVAWRQHLGTPIGELDRLLPRGPRTPGHRLWVAQDSRFGALDDPTGTGGPPPALVWVHLQDRSDGTHALCRHLGLRPGLPESDEGAFVRAALDECRAQGASSVRLQVPASAPRLRACCDRSGFSVTAQSMAKTLT